MVHSTKKYASWFDSSSMPTVFLACVFSVTSLWVGVCLLSRQQGDLALVQFLTLAILMLATTMLVLWRCRETGFNLPFWWILITAVLLRLISVGGVPLFEDDYYRYLWDGYQTVATNDPYTYAPAIYFDRDVPEIFESVLSFINYPEIATVYGPVTQWIFALGYLMAPGEVWPLQLMSAAADLGIICLLYRLGAGNALLLYAWSPLVLKEYSLTAHPDVFAVAFVLVSMLATYRQRAVLAGFAIALALGAKVFAILVIPFLLSSGWSFRFWFRLGLSAILCLTLITLSFGSITIWVPEGLLAMADSWLFNSPLYYLLLPLLSFQTLKVVLAFGFVVYAMTVFYRRVRRDWYARHDHTNVQLRWNMSPVGFRGDWLFALFLLSLPVINPWYVAWLLPFATLYPRWWSWTASYSILLSYWYGSNVGAIGADVQQLPVHILAMEYLLIILVPIAVWLMRRFRANSVSKPRQ